MKIIKTQISNLQNGCIEGASRGTNSEERSAIAAKVFAENPESITVTCNGITLTLQKSSSKSGKTSRYSREIAESELNIIEGCRPEYHRYTFESSFTLVITNDCRVLVEKSTRKSPDATWKFRGYDYLPESSFKIEG